MTTSAKTKEDRAALERAKNFLYRISAELSLISCDDTSDQMRLESARRMAADNALRLESHLRGF